MFNKIKLAIAKAAPMLFTAYAIVEEPDNEIPVNANTEPEEQENAEEKPNISDKVKKATSTVAKVFMETVPVKEETPMDLASQIVDVAFTTTAQAVITGAVTMFTANRPLPLRIVSGIIGFAAATKLSEKWKNEIVHPMVEGYKGQVKTVCASQYIDPGFNVALGNYFKDDATPEEKAEAIGTIVDAVYPTDDLQNRLFIETKGNGDMMVAVCMEVMERRAIKQSKLYTEFLNKPFVEQKWFVKAKSLFKKIKEPFADPENRETTLKALRTYTFGVGLSAVAASFAGPAWPTVFFGGLVATCCIGVSEIVAKIISIKKESVCNA